MAMLAHLLPDKIAAERFLTLLDAEAETFTFQTFDDNKDRQAGKLAGWLHGTLDEHWNKLVERNQEGAGIFVMVQAGDGSGRNNKAVRTIRAVFQEDDGDGRELPLEPHIIVESSPGKRHQYMLVDGLNVDEFKGVMARMIADYGSDPNAKDPARVLRLPGFFHLKTDGTYPPVPHLVRVIHESGAQPYSKDDVLSAFPPNTHARHQPAAEEPVPGELPPVDAEVLSDLASALAALPVPDDYQPWIGVSFALASLKRHGQGREAKRLWVNYSMRSGKWQDKDLARWDGFSPDKTHFRVIFDLAQRAGWVNPKSSAAAESDQPEPTEGEPPELLIPAAMAVPEIPASILPGVLGAMAGAVSAYTQTPPAAAVLEVLGVLAACCHRRYEVEPRAGYREPLSLWTLAALDSGSRKTAVQDKLIGPLIGWEKLERERLAAEVASVAAKRKVADKVIAKLEALASKAEPAERKRLELEIERELQEMPAELKSPRVFTSDSTSEQVQQLLVDHAERIAVIADEGGIFQIMAGAYSGGVASIDVYLQGHSGSALRVDRGSRTAHVDRPAVSFALLIQPGIMRDAGRNKRFKDSGLLARFLYAVPVSNVGRRDIRATVPIPGEVMREYHALIMALLDERRPDLKEPDILRLRPDAYERWICFAESIERRHGSGRELESITEWTSKLPGAVARIAALLHLADGPGDLVIRDDSMRRAVELGELLIPHTLAAFELMGMSGAEEDAHVLLRWVKTQRKDAFLLRDAHQALRRRFPKTDRLREAAGQLVDWNVITRRREVKPSTRGGRPTELLQVNPRLFVS